MEIVFPLGGLDRSLAYQAQRPYTTPDSLNVRPRDTIERRLRGGSRPMLRKAYQDICNLQWVGSTINSASYDSATDLTLISLASPHSDRRMPGSLFKVFGGNSYTIDSYNTTSSFYVKGDASAESGSVEVLVGAPIQNLSIVHPIPTDEDTLPAADNAPYTFRDKFNADYLDSSGNEALPPSLWTAPSGFSMPKPVGGHAINYAAALTAAAFQRIPNFNTSLPYSVSLRPYTTSGVFNLTQAQRRGMQWSLYVKMSDASPAPATDCIQASLTLDTDDGNGNDCIFRLSQTASGVTTTRYILLPSHVALGSLQIDVNGTVVTATCSSGHSLGIVTALTGNRVGFGVGSTVSSVWSSGIYTEADAFFVSGTLSTPAAYSGTTLVGAPATRPKMLVAIAGGRLYREKVPGHLDPIGTEIGAVSSSADATHAILANTTLTNTDLTGYALDFLNLFTGRSRRITAYNTGTREATYGTMGAAVTGDTYRLRPIGTTLTVGVTSATTQTIVFEDMAITRLPLATWMVQIVAGTGKGQQREISSYNAGTQTATISTGATDWTTTPDATSKAKIRPGLPIVSLRTDDVPLMAVELRGKLYIADYEDPRVIRTGALVEGTADQKRITTSPTLSTYPAANFTTVFIEPTNDLAVVTNAQGTAVDGNYAISSITEARINTTTNVASTAADSALNVRVQRAPKVFNPIADTLTLITSTAGMHPVGCPMIERYRDRLVLAGYPRQFWAMSRQGDPLDWDYTQEDDQRAVGGVAGPHGVIPDPLTSIINGNDDFFVFFCERSVWVLRGDPTNGTMTCASHSVGCIDRMARCHVPDGSIVFLARDGLYRLLPGAGGVESLSKRPLPQELMRIDTDLYWTTMCHDPIDQGIHIYLTPYSATTDAVHWWFDLGEGGTFWPMSVPNTMDAFAATLHDIPGDEDAVVVHGGRDGYVRRFHDDQVSDDGEDMESSVMIGPVRMNQVGYEGVVKQIVSEMGDGSEDVSWELYVGDTPKTAIDSTTQFTGTFEAGLNYTESARASGASMFIKLIGTGRWAFERIGVALKRGGLVRKR